MLDDVNPLQPDRHGRLPRFHYDPRSAPSPTTGADVLSWCIDQRSTPVIALLLSKISIGSSLMAAKHQITLERLGGIPARILEAFISAASEIHDFVREYGYDPTSDERTARICLAILEEHVDVVSQDDGATTEGFARPSAAMLGKLLHIGALLCGMSDAWNLKKLPEVKRLLAMVEATRPEVDEELGAIIDRFVAGMKDVLRKFNIED